MGKFLTPAQAILKLYADFTDVKKNFNKIMND